MQTANANMEDDAPPGSSPGSSASSDDSYRHLSSPETGRFTSRNDPRINEIFGNNLTLQRNTFLVFGLAMLIMLPLLTWVRSQLGSFHPLTAVVVLTAMAGCLPAIFSSHHPRLERYAGHLLIGVLAISLLTFVVLNGGLRAPILVAAPLLPLGACFLLGPPAGLFMAGCILIGIAALVAQIGGAFLLPSGADLTLLVDPQSALANAMFVAVVSVIAACIGWGFNRRFLLLQEELMHLATHDPLTDLANRKSLESALFQEAKKRRTTYPVSLIVFDIDHFKRFNDSFGHQAGDRVLKAVADIAQTNARRSSDLIARYGGDEFVIVLPDTSQNDAIQIAEQLRKHIEIQRYQLSRPDTYRSDSANNKTTTTVDDDIVTLSIGVATHPAGRYGNPYDFIDDLMARADAAMYRSKQAGGNRVFASANALNSVDEPVEAV